MSSSKPSKQESERTQKQLEALLQIPENRECADCQEPKPKWASSTLGCFLCIRCAGLHRNLGRTLSTIRSVTLDTWPQRDVDTMTLWGNRRVNNYYNPNGEKPALPSQMHVVKYNLAKSGMGFYGTSAVGDREMYRFIKEKYKKRVFMMAKDRIDLEAREVAARVAEGNNGSSSNRGGSTKVTIEADDHVSFAGQVKVLAGMGFTDVMPCLVALKKSKGNVDAAVGLLVSGRDLTPAPSPTTKEPLGASMMGEPASYSLPDTRNEPAIPPSKAIQEALGFLEGMGFANREMNLSALKSANGNVDQAVTILVQSASVAPPAVHQKSDGLRMDLLSLNSNASASSEPFTGFFGNPPAAVASQQQQDPFAALLHSSNMMPLQPSGFTSQASGNAQNSGIGMMAGQQRLGGGVGGGAAAVTQGNQYAAYSAIPNAFGGVNQQQNQMPRMLASQQQQPQQQQQQQAQLQWGNGNGQGVWNNVSQQQPRQQ
ncbi:hypothetical protein HDU98_007835 [Podochytrium sp. JEL0797]|nr:hypothetical protein HDU98_007835 [Podochytrium sp. JEL0797]